MEDANNTVHLGVSKEEEVASNASHRPSMFSRTCPKSMVVYCIQVVAIFIIILVAVCNLSLKTADKEMWITLLCSSMGYLLPNPNMKRKKIISE